MLRKTLLIKDKYSDDCRQRGPPTETHTALLLLLLSARLQTPTDRAKCHKPEGTSREGNPKKEKINKNEGKKDKNTI